MSLEVRHFQADLRQVRLHYAEAGDGPLVVLLHGFPEFWYSWRHQLPALAAAGFRAVAPDLRGYNLSDKPRGVRRYCLETLTEDIAELVEHLGGRRACIVGHDWGGFLAWHTAMRHPQLVERLAILNMPHPHRLLRGPRRLGQLRRSWYVFFFQLPVVPELALRARGMAVLRRMLRDVPARADAFDDGDIERYVAAASLPGALTSGINYYRALFRGRPLRRVQRMRPIHAPVLILWGARDPFLAPELAVPEPAWVTDARVEMLPDAGHFVQSEQPERVNALLTQFLEPVLPRRPHLVPPLPPEAPAPL